MLQAPKSWGSYIIKNLQSVTMKIRENDIGLKNILERLSFQFYPWITL